LGSILKLGVSETKEGLLSALGYFALLYERHPAGLVRFDVSIACLLFSFFSFFEKRVVDDLQRALEDDGTHLIASHHIARRIAHHVDRDKCYRGETYLTSDLAHATRSILLSSRK
jgi:hypothetical protein